MHTSIIRRLIQGFSANVYGQLVTVCAQLAGVPILLHYWGIQVYGEWLILSAIPIYLSMSDLGFAQSAGNDMTQRVARGDYQGALSVFQSIGLLIALCSIGVLTIMIVVLAFAPLPAILPLVELSERDSAWIIGLLGTEVLININGGTLHAGFRAGGGYALHSTLNSSTLLVQNLVLWVSASAGFGPAIAAGAFLIVRLIVTPLIAILLNHKYAWITFGFSKARKAELSRLLRPAVANLAFPLARGLNIQGMRLAVGMALGPVAVVTFTTLRTLTRLILQASTIVGHASEPEMAAAYGKDDTILLRKLYVHSSQLTIALVVILAGTLFWASDWILAFWTHGKVVNDSHLIGWLMACAATGAIWYMSLLVIKAANRHLRAAVFFMATAGFAVVLAYAILSKTDRLSDAGLVLLLIDIGMAIYVVPVACRLSGYGLKLFIMHLLNPFQWVNIKASGR